MMVEIPLCPSCYLDHVVCLACGKAKPKYPSGEWVGSWWYCNLECAKTPPPEKEMCPAHSKVLERLKKSHPHLFGL